MGQDTRRLGMFRNGLSLFGAAVVTITAALFLTVFLLDLFGLHTNPYLGIVFFVIVPGLFVAGLLLIPLGGLLARRRRRRLDHESREWPRLDLNDRSQRRTIFAVLVLTFCNVVIVSLAAYRGIEFMDSVEFCGTVCHEVMQPEYVAYQDGPHSRVACVRCHIGPGAPWFVKSKIDGTRQVLAVLMNSHSRPIATPVHNLRPAREVCEQCHWPEKFHGDKVNVYREYANDEQVSESLVTVRIHVGGGNGIGTAGGIHWHMNIANEIDYVSTDGRRQIIPYVRLKTRDGEVREYFQEGLAPDAPPEGERRRMDCVDCHNRPSHPFAASPERAVDAAIAGGEIPRTLPFVRREAVEALKVSYPNRAAAEQDIQTRLMAFYRSEPTNLYDTRRADVERAIDATRRLYRRNVFPGMRVQWGTHPSNIGHVDSPGCFRCHDGSHKTRDGRVISQDCSLCHELE